MISPKISTETTPFNWQDARTKPVEKVSERRQKRLERSAELDRIEEEIAADYVEMSLSRERFNSSCDSIQQTLIRMEVELKAPNRTSQPEPASLTNRNITILQPAPVEFIQNFYALYGKVSTSVTALAAVVLLLALAAISYATYHHIAPTISQ